MPIKSAQIKSIPYKQKQAHCVSLLPNLTFLQSCNLAILQDMLP